MVAAPVQHLIGLMRANRDQVDIAAAWQQIHKLEQQVGERRPELMDWMLRPERQAGATDPADRWKFCRMGRGNVVPRGLLPGLAQHAVN